MPDLTVLAQQLAIWAIPVLFAVTVHEVSHGLAAQKLGDDTAARAGRLSFNPIRHVDPVGTVLIPALLLIFKAPFLFGWAKPVPVQFGRLRSPKRDMVLVAIAGPASNLVMAIGWAALLAVLVGFVTQPSGIEYLLAQMCIAGILINLVLMFVNLIPLPPLDGGRVAVGLLPQPLAGWLARVEPFGILILVALLVTGVLGQVLYLPIALSEFALHRLFGISMVEP